MDGLQLNKDLPNYEKKLQNNRRRLLSEHFIDGKKQTEVEVKASAKQLTKTVLCKMVKIERLTDVNIACYEVVKIMLMHRIAIPPPRKGFFS